MGVAFIDTQIYIHTLVTIKHIILAGDILKSVQVYQYQEEHKVLSIVSRVSMGENQNQQLGKRNLIFTFTDPLTLFIKIKKKLIFKFRKFCNSTSCFHMLSERTAVSNTECKMINNKAETWIDVWYLFKF